MPTSVPRYSEAVNVYLFALCFFSVQTSVAYVAMTAKTDASGMQH